MSRAWSFFARTFVPLFLLVGAPPAVFIFWYINMYLHGSFAAFGALVAENGFFSTFFSIWGPIAFGSAKAWQILIVFAAFELFLMRVVPGKRFEGPLTPMANTPIYKENGPACFLITLAAFFLCGPVLGFFSLTILYDNLGAMLGALNVFALIFCAFLYFKGVLKPSSSDSGTSGNPIFDYYWGSELYPRLFGWDVKQFTNCRFGMMLWPLLLISYAAKQHQLYGLSDSMTVAVLLQLGYVGKFFFWEKGYLRSLDIMHDRAGFYICWGCLVWLPCIYTSPTLYLVQHPNHLGWFGAGAIFVLGAVSVSANFLADFQRQRVRETNGECFVWGRKPHLILADYTTVTGEKKSTVLLASGWWGLARHFHYIPELSATFFWSVPALFSHFLPYFYLVFLTILLINRASRHDHRCKEKYGSSWEQYCERVPYKLIPFVY